MGDQERGNALVVMMMMVGMSYMLFHCQVVHAELYMVEWKFNPTSYLPKGNKVKTSDFVEFTFDTSKHNLIEVSTKANYTRCTTGGGGISRLSGENITFPNLKTRYFICSKPGHCECGMKMAITTTN